MAIVGDYDDASCQIDDPAVNQFLVQFSGNDALINYFEEWCLARCAPFYGYTFQGEHTLEFTALHQAYVQEWEGQLAQFLAEQGLNAEQFAERVMQVQQKCGFGPEWMPSMVSECEYQTFFENMVARAERDSFQALAQGKAAEEAGFPDHFNLSGVYQRDMTCGSSPAEVDALHKRLGIPYPIRALLNKGLGSTTFTVHMEGTNLVFVQKAPYFPQKKESWVLDAQTRELIVPIMGWKRQITAWMDVNEEANLYQVQVQSKGNPNTDPDKGVLIGVKWVDESKSHISYTWTAHFLDGSHTSIVHYMRRIG